MKCGVALLPQVIDPLSGIAMIRWSVFLGSSPATGVVFCRRTASMDTRWGGEPVRGCLWRLLEAVIENTLAADVRRFTQITGLKAQAEPASTVPSGRARLLVP